MEKQLYVTKRNGERELLDQDKINKSIERVCSDIPHVSPLYIAANTVLTFYDGIPTKDIDAQVVLTCASLTKEHPNYAIAAARLQLQMLIQSICGSERYNSLPLAQLYQEDFAGYIERGVEIGMLNPELNKYARLVAPYIDPDRDRELKINGLRILMDRYLIRDREGKIIELPQWLFMRVALGLAISHEKESEVVEAAKKYYGVIFRYYMPSTPTLFNSGCVHSQLSSCYITEVPDNIEGIFKNYSDTALLSKWAGGIGTSWTAVRSAGSLIKGTNGKSEGVVPFLKIVDSIANAVNQGGKRKGSHCAYLETWHGDYMEFLDLRKEVGDVRRRTHDLNTASWISDLFMRRVMEGGDWTLVSPSDFPLLKDLYGAEFEKEYCRAEEMVRSGAVKGKVIPAREIWKKMVAMIFETGHPWMTFKDPINLRNPQQHAGVIHSSNLCTEITLNTSEQEQAVCNIGSINLSNHYVVNKDGQVEVDFEGIMETAKIAVEMLNDVIDNGFYPTPETKLSSKKHRPIGIGVMGYQDLLYRLGIPYESEEQLELGAKIQEYIAYGAISRSCDLAEIYGPYESFEGSLWSKGIFPYDTARQLQVERAQVLGDKSKIELPQIHLDWDALKKRVMKHGLRNSNLMAVAPTATISYITGASQNYEPAFKQMFSYENLSGTLIMVNEYLIEDLIALNLWDENCRNAIIASDGFLFSIVSGLPESIKEKYKSVFEIDQKWIIRSAALRGAWIDQSQSVNLYHFPKGAGDAKAISDYYFEAWLRGLKTTYYLRTIGASQASKVTSVEPLKTSHIDNPVKVCLLQDPSCEACQ